MATTTRSSASTLRRMMRQLDQLPKGTHPETADAVHRALLALKNVEFAYDRWEARPQ